MKTIRIADIITNDVINGQGICTSVWLQGCPHHCPGCHNPEAWNFDGGTLYDQDMVTFKILKIMRKNGIQRNLSILGGEPLCPQNAEFVRVLCAAARYMYPDIKIFCWTGYNLEDIHPIFLKDIDVLIDGKFELDKRDVSLPLRGSSNQRIIHLKEGKKI